MDKQDVVTESTPRLIDLEESIVELDRIVAVSKTWDVTGWWHKRTRHNLEVFYDGRASFKKATAVFNTEAQRNAMYTKLVLALRQFREVG